MPVTKKMVKLNHKQHNYPAKRNDTVAPENVSIAYVMLIHDQPELAHRIILSLLEPQHHFVIHVDARAHKVHEFLLEKFHKININGTIYSNDSLSVINLRLNNLSLDNDSSTNSSSSVSLYSNIHFVNDNERVNITWGAYSMVNATLIGMRYAYTKELKYDFLINFSGTTFPIKSNAFIRSTLSKDMHAIFMNVVQKPARPESHMYNYYVECDAILHRIYRMPLIKGMLLLLLHPTNSEIY